MFNGTGALGFMVGDIQTNVTLSGGDTVKKEKKLVASTSQDISWQPGNKVMSGVGPDKQSATSRANSSMAAPTSHYFKDSTLESGHQTANTSWRQTHNVTQDYTATFSGTNNTYQQTNTTNKLWGSSSSSANVTDAVEIDGYIDRKLVNYDTNGSLLVPANKSFVYAQTATLTSTENNKQGMWTLPSPEWNATTWTNYTHTFLYDSDLGGNASRPSNVTELGHNDTIILTGYVSGYTTDHIILASIFVTLLMIVIVVGNALVIWAIALDRNLRALQNWFIASLAVSDLLVGLLIMPFSLANELMGYWYFGNILCELWLATDVMLCTASILNLCLISLDRYWSITRALSYVKQRTKKRAAIMIALVWALSAIICFPPLVGWKRPQPTMYGLPLCVLSEDIGYVVYSTLGSFYIPLIVMVVVYFKIYLAARSRARRNLKKTPQSKPVAENGKSTSTTTTSFSTPSRGHEIKQHLDECKDLNSIEDDTSQVGDAIESPEEGDKGIKTYQLNVPKSHVHYKPLDEKRKLLSDDTDSACDSPIKKVGKTGKRIHFSEETDSTSDTTSSKLKFPSYKPVMTDGSNEENMKPLLEDSQLESDSQRETDRTLPHNNNVESDKDTANTQVDSAREDSQDHGSTSASQNATPCKHNHNHKKMMLLTPASFKRVSLNIRKEKTAKEKKRVHHQHQDDPEKRKKAIARAKERRAFIVLGVIMATFILCWLPFFMTYLISSLFGLHVPTLVFAIFFWGGYCNSALNPVIYTIFNQDFRKAFQKIVCGRRGGY